MVSSVLVRLARVPAPLQYVAMCGACDECFELGPTTCPACGSGQHMPLAAAIRERVVNVTGLN